MTEMDILKNPCLQFVVEDDFSYFCRYDDLSGIYSGISKEVPALADSCYINRAEVFLPPRKWDDTMPRILPDSYEIDVALQLTVEDDFSYFCKFDDLANPIVQPDFELPSITNSCYISREEVFGQLL